MNKVERALWELGEMDRLADGRSWVHRRDPLAKLAVMVLWPALLFQLSGVPVSACFRKLRFVLPLVLAVGLFNPLFDKAPRLVVAGVAVSGGVISMATLMLKGVLCLSASFLLMATTSIDALCAALRRVRVPGTLVTLLLLTFRYVGVLMEELAVMTEAYQLRAPGQRGIHVSAWGSFLGQLLLRSMDRAEELYASMRLRGFHGEFYYAGTQRPDLWDWAYAVGCVGVFLLVRRYDVAGLLGGLVVR